MGKAYIVLNGKRYNLQEQEDKASKPDPEKGDPRYVDIPGGVTAGGEGGTAPQDTRQLVEGMYEVLKTILSRIDQNMPYISRACDRDGGN